MERMTKEGLVVGLTSFDIEPQAKPKVVEEKEVVEKPIAKETTPKKTTKK